MGDGRAGAKAGERVAGAIIADIRALGWPVGHRLGAEGELIARYGVSRAVLREAIRQVEQSGVAVMRRGRGGGLVVSMPVEEAVVRAIVGYLEAIDVELGAIREAQFLLEVQATALACERIDASGISRLRALAAAFAPPTGVVEIDGPPHTEVRTVIAEVAGNRVLALFIRALNRSTVEMRSMLAGPGMEDRYRERVERSIADKQALVEAIVAGDGAKARQIVERDTSALHDLFARPGAQRREVASMLRDPDKPSDARLSQAVMFRLAEEVARMRLPPGERLGSEAEMLARYGVGRSVFREAIRPLEQHGVVRMRRGVGGGLFVAAPDPSVAVTAAVDHFRQMKLTPAEVLPVLATLLIEAIPLVVAHADAEQIARLRTVLGSGQAFDRELAGMCGNPVLSLLIRILIEVAGETHGDRAAQSVLVDAIEAGDAALARRQMKRLLSV